MDPNVTSIITAAVGDLSDQVLALAPVGLGIGVVVFALGFGWRFVRSLIS